MVKVAKVKTVKRKALKITKRAHEPAWEGDPGNLGDPPKKGVKIRKRNPTEIRFPETVLKNERPRKKDGTMNAGRFLVTRIAKGNARVQHVWDQINKLPRDMLADRLALIYCEILGLAGAEAI